MQHFQRALISLSLLTAFGCSSVADGPEEVPASQLEARITDVGSGDVVAYQGRITTSTANSPFTDTDDPPEGGVAYLPVLVNNNTPAARLKFDTNGDVTLQFKGAAPAAPYLVHLNGVQYLRNGVDAQALPLGPGWSKHAATRTPSAVKMANGFVHLMGGLVGSNNASIASPFTLAVGLRPPSTTYVNITLCNATKGRLWIRPDGAVNIQAEGNNDAADARCFTSLDGVSFATSVVGATGVAYMNGWSGAMPSGHLRFRNDGAVVRFQGSVIGGTSNVVINLPPAYRPADAVFLPVDRADTTRGIVAILVSGDVMIIPVAGGGISDATNFDGLSFVR